MRLSLKAKLVLMFVLLISIPVLVLGFFSYKMAADSLQQTIEQQLKENNKLIAESIELTVESVREYVKLVSKTPQLIETAANSQADKTEAFAYMADLQRENSSLLEMLIITDLQGKTIMTNQSLTANEDLSDRDYLKKALGGSEAISEVIMSRFTGKPVIAIAEPLKLENKVVGALVATILFDKIFEHAAKVKIGENGYAYMIDKNGLVVYHPKKEKIFKENLGDTDNPELKALVQKMKAGETADGYYTYEGVKKFVRFQPAGNWVLAITANYDEYMAPAFAIKNRTLIIIGVALLLALSLSYILSTRNIINPLKQLQLLMEKAGKGDLTVYAQISTKDEIQALGESFNQMITHQAEIVRQVRTSAQELVASSQEMAASSEQVNSATEQITASIQQVAKDADTQNSSVIEASKALVQLASLVQLAQHKALSANEKSANTMKTAQDGRIKVMETVQAIHVINEKASDTAEVVQQLSKLSATIGEIISTINAIAAQTDLLALNAAIEAARAGEHGRGFAVVAEEVRKLSEESHQGASEIAALVSEMVKLTDKAVESMKDGKEAVDNGVKVVKATDQAFAEIIAAVEETVRNIQEIVDITRDEVATSEQVVNLINTIASITEATAANSQEVSAATEEQAAAVQTVAATAEETSAMANSLENLVRVFKLAEAK